MDFGKFNNNSQQYLASIFATKSIDPTNQDLYEILNQPAVLNNQTYQLYASRSLSEYKPNQQVTKPIAYTHFILVPPEQMRADFLHELEQKKSGQAPNQGIISQYYLPLTPGNPDFEKLINDLTTKSKSRFTTNGNSLFSFHLVCPSANYYFVLIFVEMNSVVELNKQFPAEVPFINPENQDFVG